MSPRVCWMGADELIDYKSADFETKGETYDLVFDCIGNAPYGACTRVLRGRRIHVSTTSMVGDSPPSHVRLVVNAQRA